MGGYEISPQNYQVVKDLIDKEYGKTELIIDAHLKKLFRLMGSSPGSSDAGFQALYIEASTHARALKALNHNEENIKSTMLTLLPDKMPGEMKKNVVPRDQREGSRNNHASKSLRLHRARTGRKLKI